MLAAGPSFSRTLRKGWVMGIMGATWALGFISAVRNKF